MSLGGIIGGFLGPDPHDVLGSTPVTPTSPVDEFGAPSEYVSYEGSAPPRRKSNDGSQQVVWDQIAKRHPRKFRKALAYLQWLDRMEKRYGERII